MPLRTSMKTQHRNATQQHIKVSFVTKLWEGKITCNAFWYLPTLQYLNICAPTWLYLYRFFSISYQLIPIFEPQTFAFSLLPLCTTHLP